MVPRAAEPKTAAYTGGVSHASRVPELRATAAAAG
jgi:hypothetical protein